MTGYHITIGYLSGDDKDEAWVKLKDIVFTLCNHPALIRDEAIRFGVGALNAAEYADAYVDASEETRGTTDSTLRIIEAKDGEPPQIMQLASGSGESRLIKEAMRRAFCRLVMYEMHKLGLEININVA